MEKAKSCVFCLLVVYSVTIITLLYNSEKNAITQFDFKDSKENMTKITQLENQYNSLTKNECTNSIKQLIDDYKKTSYKNGVTVNELRNLFFQNNKILGYTGNAIKKCNISEKEKKELTSKVVTISINRTEIYDEIKFPHEIHIKDNLLNIMIASNTISSKYSINKQMQLEIIEELIEISSKGND